MAPDPKSFYWYDLETTGLNRRWDRITQFAGQRTDLDLNPIDEPYVTYVKLPPEVLPDPDATLVTGVPPQEIQEQGISEWEAINEIHERFMVPGTCAIGYNSIAFDDEFIRFALYRNLFPPYAREFRRGNSRADLYAIVRAAAAMRPTKIQWPQDEEGTINTSLSALAAANGIDPEGAHDAHADVRMSIELAKIIKNAEPRMWGHLMANRSRDAIQSILDDESRFYLHVASTYGAKRHFAAPVRVLATNPDINTRVLVADLTADLSMLESASPKELHEARYLSQEEAEATGSIRLHVGEIAINKCPVLVGLDKLTDDLAQRLKVDVDTLEHNINFLESLDSAKFRRRMQDMMRVRDQEYDTPTDPAEMLYEGFFNRSDERLCEEVHTAVLHGQPWPEIQTEDRRIKVLANRLRYELQPDEVPQLAEPHRKYVQDALQRQDVGIKAKRNRIKELSNEDLNIVQVKLLHSVSDYLDEIAVTYDLT